jgi:adenosine 3'-phospho 5'-phosphosulfate transporter B3
MTAFSGMRDFLAGGGGGGGGEGEGGGPQQYHVPVSHQSHSQKADRSPQKQQQQQQLPRPHARQQKQKQQQQQDVEVDVEGEPLLGPSPPPSRTSLSSSPAVRPQKRQLLEPHKVALAPLARSPQQQSASGAESIWRNPFQALRWLDALLGRIAKEQRERDRSEHFDEEEVQAVEALPREVGFRVMGVEIAAWSETQQYIFVTSVLFASLLVYGYLQEYLVMVVFKREHPLFLTLLQFGGYSVLARLQRLCQGVTGRHIPRRYYFTLGVMLTANQALTNASLQHLNYPAKVLFKSSRIVPTMVFGMIYQGRRYPARDYAVVSFIVLGLVTFMSADAKTSPNFSPLGVALISLALLVDAATINVQEELLNFYSCSHDEVVYFSYLWGTGIMLLLSGWTGDLWWGVSHMVTTEEGHRMVFGILAFSAVGFVGVSCMAALTKHFGALVSSITSTARKAVTLALSFVFFPKPVGLQHAVGGGLFMLGLLIKATARKAPSHRTARSPTNSPDGTPATFRMALASGRKRLTIGGRDEGDAALQGGSINGTRVNSAGSDLNQLGKVL